MDLSLSHDLMKLLKRSIAARDSAGLGRPSSSETHRRALHIAEIEAIRELQATGSLDDGLLAGLAAFDREMRYFSPISLLHEAEEAAAYAAEDGTEANAGEG